MGIPKFYRWLSERYPLVNQKLTMTEGPPDIDNLYLDMNGIIHNCTHANRKEVNATEDEMMLKVFDYLDKLIQIIRPQKVLFMAIDGVAPRAKMNQQRSRRFKSAMERIKNEEEARKKGQEVSDDPFDSNCITPGTEFMARLGKHLRFFIRRKVAEDPLWQKPAVVFSGHEVPGEGEHKIMEYIRWEKRQPSYQPNQRHCLYGLDADLIMLSLVSHEPHFCLLREVVSYTGSNRGQPAREVLDNPCAENFILFQIGLLREYLELEFAASGVQLPFPLDVERVVDDFVLFCMLIGNDFLPALPTLDIAEGALNNLIELYKQLLPQMGGYLTYAGELDRSRLELLLSRLGQMEQEVLEERAQDAEYMEGKRAKRAARMGQRSELDESDAGNTTQWASATDDGSLEPPAAAPAAVPAGPTMMSRAARQLVMAGAGRQGLEMWKERYYTEKLHVAMDDRREVAEHYLAGLHWVLEYYYRGVASWDWYYPYHYAPMASDLVHLDTVQVAFVQGKPFKPFEQLLSVLPAASGKLLPAPYRALMTNPHSPILDFYPETFQVDMEGKRSDWEGVVLVPFVDEVRLLQAAQSVAAEQLTAEERSRNALGDIQVFQYHTGSTEKEFCTSTMPKLFKDITVCNSHCIKRPPPPPLPAGGKGFVPQLVPGTGIGLQAPQGMMTLKTLTIKPSLRKIGVNVLGSASKRDSLVVAVRDLREALDGKVLSAEQVSSAGLLGARCYVNWPYLQEARVVRVTDRVSQVSLDAQGKPQIRKWQPPEANRWEGDAAQLAASLLTKHGIDAGHVDIVVSVRTCLGYIRHMDGTIQKTYSEDELQVPLQVVIRNKPQLGDGVQGADPAGTLAKLQVGQKVVFLGKHHYGCMATAQQDLGVGLSRSGKVAKPSGHYRLTVQPVPDSVGVNALRAAKRVVTSFATKYYNSAVTAERVRVSTRLLGRVTGNMWVRDGEDRYDLGVAVKAGGKGVCVPGFSAPTEDGNGWMYSAALIQILQDYRRLHPWVWEALVKMTNAGGGDAGPGDLRLEQMLPGLNPSQRRDKARAVADWIKTTPLAKKPLVKSSVQILSDEGVRALQNMAPVPWRPPSTVEYENVPPALILAPYTPGANEVKYALQGGPFELGDRVVCVSGKGSPPFGTRGTIIGVFEDACEVMFDEEFSGGTNLNGRVGGKCGAFVPSDLLLNISTPASIQLAKHQVPKQLATHAAHEHAPGADEAAAATTPAADAAPAASKHGKSIALPGSGNSVPAGACPMPPAAPPAPSSKLLGLAARAVTEAMQPVKPHTGPEAALPAAGGSGGSNDVASLTQKLQMLMPNARVRTAAQHGQGHPAPPHAPPPPSPQSPAVALGVPPPGGMSFHPQPPPPPGIVYMPGMPPPVMPPPGMYPVAGPAPYYASPVAPGPGAHHAAVAAMTGLMHGPPQMVPPGMQFHPPPPPPFPHGPHGQQHHAVPPPPPPGHIVQAPQLSRRNAPGAAPPPPPPPTRGAAKGNDASAAATGASPSRPQQQQKQQQGGRKGKADAPKTSEKPAPSPAAPSSASNAPAAVPSAPAAVQQNGGARPTVLPAVAALMAADAMSVDGISTVAAASMDNQVHEVADTISTSALSDFNDNASAEDHQSTIPDADVSDEEGLTSAATTTGGAAEVGGHTEVVDDVDLAVKQLVQRAIQTVVGGTAGFGGNSRPSSSGGHDRVAVCSHAKLPEQGSHGFVMARGKGLPPLPPGLALREPPAPGSLQ